MTETSGRCQSSQSLTSTEEPLCDIGPTPFGDGIVDVQDLIVLAEHLFKEFPPVEPAE